MAQPNTSTDVAPTQLPTETAYAAILSEVTAMPHDNLAVVNLDVVSAVTTVLGTLPELRALREQIQDQLPRFDLARFDRLEQYALGLNHANAIHRAALTPRSDTIELGNALTVIRDRLYSDAMSLANHSLLDGERLRECKRAVGYRPVATDVLTLVAVFKEQWPKLEGKTPVSLAALNDAGTRAVELLAAVGIKDQAPVTAGEAALIRQKALTLLLNAYDDARRAVGYLRAVEEDADDIAPSLYAGRGGRRRPAPDESVENGTGANPAASDVAPAATQSVDNSVGLPITDPFSNN